jgi:hypothetical protein
MRRNVCCLACVCSPELAVFEFTVNSTERILPGTAPAYCHFQADCLPGSTASLWREPMRLNIALAGAFVVGLALPAAAQTSTTSYYVVQDVKTKKCTVIDKKPTTTEYTTVGDDGVVYKTRVEAENAMKTVKVCTTE